MIDTVPSLGCGFLHDHQTNSPDRTGGGGKTRTQSAVGSMNNLQQFRKSSMDLVCWSGAQQDAVWNRQHVANQLRSLLCEYYAAFLEAFPGSSRWTGVSGGLAYPDACAVLAIASTPTQAARLTHPQLNAALRREGRQRGIAAACIRLQLLWSWRQTWPIQHQTLPAARRPPTPLGRSRLGSNGTCSRCPPAPADRRPNFS